MQHFESVSKVHLKEKGASQTGQLEGYVEYLSVRCAWYGVQPVEEATCCWLASLRCCRPCAGPWHKELPSSAVTRPRGEEWLGGPSTDPGFSLLQCTFHLESSVDKPSAFLSMSCFLLRVFIVSKRLSALFLVCK